MTKWNLIIDVERCEDCNNCFLACKDEHVDNEWPGYTDSQPLHGHRWIDLLRKERGQYPLIDVAYLPVPCMHCDTAPCIKAAKEGAFYKREDGIVLIDPDKAKGQKDILKACPYEAIWWNDEKNVPQKCTLCAHLLDEGWTEPRCVQACPTGALEIIREVDGETNVVMALEDAEVLYPEYKTAPRVYYRNLYRYFRCFVAGSVSFQKEGATECAAEARVELWKNAEQLQVTVTDSFGDFKIDNLEENSGSYRIVISYRDYAKKEVPFDLKTSINVGEISLEGN
ncbi:4Fe-4S dicluster domain-containing protein [Thermodesulfobacteriota bacterium]